MRNYSNNYLRLSIACLVLSSFLFSCNNMKKFYLSSPDMEHSITIFYNHKFRYIANGEHKHIPDTNYIKIDVSNVPALGDYICVCWQTKYSWELIVDKSTVIENKLDTTQFNFKTNLPKDENGVPSVKKFRESNCALFDFYSMRLIPDRGAIVRY